MVMAGGGAIGQTPAFAGAVMRDALAGVPDAMRLAANLAGGAGDWDVALDWLEAAAAAGQAKAESELVVMSPDRGYLDHLTALARQGRDFPADVWRRLRASVDISQLTRPPPAITLSNDPDIRAAPGMVAPTFGRWLMAEAQPHLRQAKVTQVGRPDAFVDPRRSNRHCFFKFELTGLPLLALRARMAAFAGLPVACLEPTSVMSYAPGQQFTIHHDAYDEGDSALLEGQRRYTLLIYLNEDYQAGETDFPNLDWRFRGRPGEALMWRNADDAGKPDRRLMHAGTPPTAGEKWIVSQWMRDRPLA